MKQAIINRFPLRGTFYMHISEELFQKAERIVLCFKQTGQKVAFVESCTGGLITHLVASVPGASTVLEAALVTYSIHAKEILLGIPHGVVQEHGDVSGVVARLMAERVMFLFPLVDVSISVTGTAGRKVGRDGKTNNETGVGTVFIGKATRTNETIVTEYQFGDRARRTIQVLAAEKALDTLMNRH